MDPIILDAMRDMFKQPQLRAIIEHTSSASFAELSAALGNAFVNSFPEFSKARPFAVKLTMDTMIALVIGNWLVSHNQEELLPPELVAVLKGG